MLVLKVVLLMMGSILYQSMRRIVKFVEQAMRSIVNTAWMATAYINKIRSELGSTRTGETSVPTTLKCAADYSIYLYKLTKILISSKLLRRNPPGLRGVIGQNYVPKLFSPYCKLLCYYFKYLIKRNLFQQHQTSKNQFRSSTEFH